MSQPLDLAKLLAEVGRARSPLKRLRLLAQGWRALKGLGRDERREVARSAGLLGFEELLERLGHGGPEEAEALREVLEAAEEIDPSRAVETMRALRDPVRRKELIRRGAAVLTETLAREKDARGRETSPSAPRPHERAAEAASSSWAAATTTPGMPSPDAPARLPVRERVSAPSMASIPMARPEPTGGDDHPVFPEGVDLGSPADPHDEVAPSGRGPRFPPGEPAASPAEASVHAASPPRDVAGAGSPITLRASQASPHVLASRDSAIHVRPGVVSRGAELRWPAGAGMGPRPRGGRPAASLRRGYDVPAGGETGPVSLHQRIEGVRSLVGRFRLLREAIASGERPEGERLDRILARFAPGWQRRRALATILRAGLPAILDEALERIEALERPTDRAWCLRALAEGRDLEEQDLRRIVGASDPGAHGRGAG